MRQVPQWIWNHNRRLGDAAIRFGMCLLVLIVLVFIAACGSGTTSKQGVTAPTATPGPPTPTPTTQQRLIILARQALGSGVVSSEVTYDATTQKLQVTGTLKGNVPLTTAQVNTAYMTVKTLSFQVERAEWTSGIPLQDVMVTIQGPAFDDYADLYTTWYGIADLKAGKAARFSWASLTPESAWDAYDTVILRLRFQPAVVGIPPTDPSTTPTP
jgi:hypothetical protein